MQFKLNIACDGAAFTRETNDEDNGTPDPGPEVARLLRAMADRVEAGPFNGADLYDVNGNHVGRAAFRED